jgi:hypothetical protein
MLKAKTYIKNLRQAQNSGDKKVKVFSLQAIRQVGEWRYVQSCLTLLLDGSQ